MRKKLLDYLSERQSQINNEIEFLEKRIRNTPEGTLKIGHCKGHTQYYVSGKYLKSNETGKARLFAQKTYDKLEIERAKKEKELIDTLLSFLINSQRVIDLLSPKRRALVTPYELSDDEFAQQWLSKPYEKKDISNAARVYKTDKGDLVRSKTEALIANMLFHAGVPYVYEKKKVMKDGQRVYPDFIILNKRTREYFILEHFGMMDDAEYRDVFFRKIKTYMENDILIGVNLFVTFEGQEYGHEFSSDYIKKLIKEVFT